MKILTVVGARPQFIKASAVSRAIRDLAGVQEVLVHTGQHYDANMSQIFFDELEIPAPTRHLGIGSGGHGAQTGQMLGAIEEVLLAEKPDCVLVYGDTNSTLAGAVAAAKLHVPIAHVEAGLRSFNRRMPEEVNRVLTDHASSLLFAPTDVAVRNLKREGLPSERVFQVGDVMFDTALFFAQKAAEQSQVLSTLGVQAGQYILASIHRAENTDVPARLAAIVDGLRRVGEQHKVVLPLHPRTQKALQDAGLFDSLTERVLVCAPVGYLDMVQLEKNAQLILTDSGGVQKEAYFYEVPCVTLRDETEWVELVESGWNSLTPPVSGESIATKVQERLGTRGMPGRLYGVGDSANRIVNIIREYQ